MVGAPPLPHKLRPSPERESPLTRACPPAHLLYPWVDFCGSLPFASIRFHVLLNSLFKVLFNFPSRYLFAIGLVLIFSLRWSLPPTLGSILKLPDSEDLRTRETGPRHHMGLTPSQACPVRKNSDARPPPQVRSRTPHFPLAD